MTDHTGPAGFVDPRGADSAAMGIPVPPVSQHHGVITVQGEPGLQLVAHCARVAIRQAPQGVSTHALRNLHSVAISALARSRQGNLDCRAAEPNWNGQGGDDWIDVAEAAAELGLSRRSVQRLALTLHGSGKARRVGDSWALKRSAALALARERRRKAHDDTA